MSDIRKRTGRKGTTYQVRYPSRTAKSGYAYKSFDTLKEARAFREDAQARQKSSVRQTDIRTVEQAIDRWLDICEKEGRDGRDPVSQATLDQYKYRSRIMKGYHWDRPVAELEEPDLVEFRSWLLRNNSRDAAQKVLSSFHSVLLEMGKRGVIAVDPGENITVEIEGIFEAFNLFDWASATGSEMPEPPPSAPTCAAVSRNTSAITQVPMAK